MAIRTLELGRFTLGVSSRSGGVALPGRPAQCKKQPERPERGRAHGARLDGAAAVRSAQQVTSLPRLQQLCKASLREENNAGAAEERAEEGRVQERRGGGGELRAEEKAEDTEAGPGAPTLATAGARGPKIGTEDCHMNQRE